MTPINKPRDSETRRRLLAGIEAAIRSEASVRLRLLYLAGWMDSHDTALAQALDRLATEEPCLPC